MSLRRATVAVKPTLTAENMQARVQFALDELQPHPTLPNSARFCDMLDRIHVDEKWFCPVEKSTGVCLADDEEIDGHTTSHKSHIPKIMFLCAVARPRFVPALNQHWDGKIGIWPLAERVPAKKASKNRPAGTLEWKPLSAKGDVHERWMMEKVLPAIAAPPGPLKNVAWRIQEDNAPGHQSIRRRSNVEALAVQLGINMRMHAQPPNGPDFNILDLGFFRALQATRYTLPRHNKDQLIDAVKQAFDRCPAVKLNRLFLTLQSCLDESLKFSGGNKCKIPHMNKAKMEKEKTLPLALTLSREAYEMAIGH